VEEKMQTVIMTVGTSLLTNKDEGLSKEKRRPWLIADGTATSLGGFEPALRWMNQTNAELISAETNTLLRFNLMADDAVVLMHSDTPSGLECAGALQEFFVASGQKNVELKKLPGINYAEESQPSALERMFDELKRLIDSARGEVTLAATGGFKAQTMVMAIVGQHLGVPVCYIHEQYQGLVYLPFFPLVGSNQPRIRRADLPESGKPREKVVNVQEGKAHHRPDTWPKLAKLLESLPWVDNVYYYERAYGAPRNNHKHAPQKTPDGRWILWIHLHQDAQHRMAVAVETTGYTPEHLEAASSELRERMGRLN
jgi:putative CRISPR-associated protein (TIGR02619 family)